MLKVGSIPLESKKFNVSTLITDAETVAQKRIRKYAVKKGYDVIVFKSMTHYGADVRNPDFDRSDTGKKLKQFTIQANFYSSIKNINPRLP